MSDGLAPESASFADGPVDVSVLIPVLNEELHIRETVTAMRAQSFDGSIELLFADGRSRDRTREILEELAASDSRIRVLDNPRRQTASGLNVCLRERGEFVARMDAHTYYSPRYLAVGVERLRRGDTEWVSGPAVPRGAGAISRAVERALASPLGASGGGKFSDDEAGSEERELDTGVFGGVWRRSTLLAVGGWDERWPINQDSEMAARFLGRGARLVSVPEMASRYVPRDSIRSLARQYYRYGLYRARTFRHHPHSMRRTHLVAPGLVVMAAATIIGPRSLRSAARAGSVAYLATLVGYAACGEVRDARPSDRALLLAVVPTMHFAWGAGVLAGIARFGLPIAAVAQALRGGGAPTRASGREDLGQDGVYAPSLHDTGR
jgi:glycosyltransferase involved in cell wall biosynthesis